MKGRIRTIKTSYGFIKGEDGNDYFFFYEDVNRKKIKRGYIVEFEVIDEGKDNLKAKNINVIGLGKWHPYANDISRVMEFLKDNCADNEELGYRLRDLNDIYNYFANLEDLK